MKLLENLYEKPPKLTAYSGRKAQITASKTLLLGPRKCGKTALILDYLGRYKEEEYLYIDLHDARVNEHSLRETLFAFLDSHPICLLVIENYHTNFTLPNVPEIILSSDDLHLHVKDFEILMMDALDFEEYIAFDKRHFNINHLFNLYANHGRLPGCALMEEHDNRRYLQEVLHLTLPDPLSFDIFQFYALHQSQLLSLHQVYQGLKEHTKISKDKCYKVSEQLQNKGLLHLIPKWKAPKASKKVYLGDFAFKNALTFDKDFQKRFANIVYCELIKLHTEVYYTEEMEFYLPQKQLAILCIPFLPPELIYRRFARLTGIFETLHVKQVHVITVGNEGRTEHKKIPCEILPFWEWAVQLEV